eukprot:469241-Alexandrium_andersonii.AAC.1
MVPASPRVETSSARVSEATRIGGSEVSALGARGAVRRRRSQDSQLNEPPNPTDSKPWMKMFHATGLSGQQPHPHGLEPLLDASLGVLGDTSLTTSEPRPGRFPSPHPVPGKQALSSQ